MHSSRSPPICQARQLLTKQSRDPFVWFGCNCLLIVSVILIVEFWKAKNSPFSIVKKKSVSIFLKWPKAIDCICMKRLQGVVVKGGLISEWFSLWLISSKKRCSIPPLSDYYPLKEKMLRGVVWQRMERKLSEIKPPLALKLSSLFKYKFTRKK